jgi:hypothetical protein
MSSTLAWTARSVRLRSQIPSMWSYTLVLAGILGLSNAHIAREVRYAHAERWHTEPPRSWPLKSSIGLASRPNRMQRNHARLVCGCLAS